MAIRYTFSNKKIAYEIADLNYSDVEAIECDTEEDFIALLNSHQRPYYLIPFKILSSVTIKMLSKDVGDPLSPAKIRHLIAEIHGEQALLKTIVIQDDKSASAANADDETEQSESDVDSSDSDDSVFGFDRARSDSEGSILSEFSDDSLDGEFEHVFPKSRDYLSVVSADGLMKNLGHTQNNTLTHLHIDGADLSTLGSEKLKDITLPALKTLSANKLTISLGELLVLLAQAPAIETIDLTNCTISLDYDTSAKDMKALYDRYETLMTKETVDMFDELLLRTLKSFHLDESDEELVDEPYALSEPSISPVTPPELSSSDSISTTTTGTSHTSETDYAVRRPLQKIEEADLDSSLFSEDISDIDSLKDSIESSFRDAGRGWMIQERADKTAVIVTDGSKKLMEAGCDKVKVYSGFLNPKQTPLDMKKKAQLILHSLGIPSEGEDIPNRLYFKGEDKNPKLVQAIKTQLSELRQKRYVDSRPRWRP